MTDESTSGDGNPEKLSALEREKRIRGLFNHWAASREGLDWYPLIWDKKTGYFSESILTPDDIYKMPCLPKEQKKSYSLFTIAWWYLEDEFHPCAGYHEIPEQILSVMGNLDILPQNFTKEDMCCFLAERAALAGWRELDFLAKEDDVPLGAPIWWMKYLKQPDVNAINPVKICAFLITAKMLPPNFREIDFLKFILERHYISAAIPSNHFGCVDNPLIWELSAEGIATAEQLGLLDSSGNLIETETTHITLGAGAGPVKTESRTKRTSTRGKGGNKPKRIWHKLLVKACIEKKITGTAVIAEILKAYLDETALLDDEGSIVSEINYQDVRHDSDYVTSGKFDAFLKKNRNNKKLIGGNDAETKTFKAWLSKNYKH